MIYIIDNYDSFTYNLMQYFRELTPMVRVVRSDQVSLADIGRLAPELIVLSPGPGHPEEATTCLKVLNQYEGEIPILGICLGHQAIVHFYGGEVEKGQAPVHGKVSPVEHDGRTVYETLPKHLKVTRYHSLHTPEDKLPQSLEVSARTIDGVVMSVRHRIQPIEGIQFHPESIKTEHGFSMLENAYKWAKKFAERREGVV